jgi:hypothetical protein
VPEDADADDSVLRLLFEFARGENVWLGKTEVRDEMR